MKKILKPWGYEQILEKNKDYMFKKLFMKKGHRCSLQFHRKKIETLFVIKGMIKLVIIKKKKKINKTLINNDFYTLPIKTIHRMEALVDSYYLESSSPHIDDVVRLSDDYRRK